SNGSSTARFMSGQRGAFQQWAAPATRELHYHSRNDDRLRATTVKSAHENWGLMQKGGAVDLLNDEIRHVGARDEPAHPVARIDQCAIGVRLWPICRYYGRHDLPVELAIADDPFLHILVVVDAPQQQMQHGVIKKSAMAAAVASPEACHADQPFDVILLHRGDEQPCRFGEKPRGPKDDFRPR